MSTMAAHGRLSAADVGALVGVSGTTIVQCWRRAKLIVIDLSSGDRIVVQPRFTGALLIDDHGSLPEEERRYLDDVRGELERGVVVIVRFRVLASIARNDAGRRVQLDSDERVWRRARPAQSRRWPRCRPRWRSG